MTASYHAVCLVAGESIEGRRRAAVHNPANVAEVVGTYPLLDAADIDTAIEAAAKAQLDWAVRSPVDRAAAVLEAADYLRTVDGLAAMITREQGKVAWEADFEIAFFEAVAAYFAGLAPQLDCGEVRTDDGMGTVTVYREPEGVIAAITPWNWPFALTAMKLVPALIAGNAVVAKPAPTTPLTVLAGLGGIAQLFPTGLISLVTGEDDVVARRMVEHPLVRHVSFTGSVPTGRKVASLAAATIKKTTLELGGNDAALLLDDVEVDETLCGNLAAAAFTTTGQLCFGVKRVYAPRAIADAVAAGIGDILEDYVVGDGMDPATSMGPLNNRRQRDFVRHLVEDAAARGANVRTCGTLAVDPELGWFLRPTVVTGVDDVAPIVAEEQFGPALPVLAYDSLPEAIDRVNDTEYGLTSSVWTQDEEHAAVLARCLQTGTTFINTHGLFAIDFNSPFGGVKQSGVGREGAIEGLLAYTEAHAVSNRHL
jgi:aldehyde dehydrogenase